MDTVDIMIHALSRRGGEGFSSLQSYRTIVTPYEWGFQLSALDGNEIVGTATCGQIIDFDTFPPELEIILSKSKTDGIPTFLTGIAVEERYRKTGVGAALWKLSLKKLSKRTTLPFNKLIQDESGGWAAKILPTVRQHLESLGRKSNELWTGVIDSNDSWLVHYQKPG